MTSGLFSAFVSVSSYDETFSVSNAKIHETVLFTQLQIKLFFSAKKYSSLDGSPNQKHLSKPVTTDEYPHFFVEK